MHRDPQNRDSQIWEAFIKGSEEAFDTLYDQYFPLLYNYGLRMSYDVPLVKDCIQELFVELWRKQEGLNQVHSVRFYLMKSLRRKIIRQLNQSYQYKEDFTNLADFRIELSPEFSRICREADEATCNILKNAINELPSRQKEIIFLKFYQNHSYQEIASIMGFQNEQYARQLVYRTLYELRKSLRNTHIPFPLPVLLALCIIS